MASRSCRPRSNRRLDVGRINKAGGACGILSDYYAPSLSCRHASGAKARYSHVLEGYSRTTHDALVRFLAPSPPTHPTISPPTAPRPPVMTILSAVRQLVRRALSYNKSPSSQSASPFSCRFLSASQAGHLHGHVNDKHAAAFATVARPAQLHCRRTWRKLEDPEPANLVKLVQDFVHWNGRSAAGAPPGV